MSWEKAGELVTTLRGKGRSDEDIINKLIETTDRYRGRCEQYGDRVSELKSELIQVKKDCGKIVQVRVDMIQRYGFRKIIWIDNVKYAYSSNHIWVPLDEKVSLNWPDETHYGKFKVWVELHKKQQDVVCHGITMGFVNGMTCIALDVETQRKMYLNTGDEVTVTKVRKHFKG